MRYLGGKAKAGLGKEIAQIVSVLRGTRDIYIEPFLGGGNVLEHIEGFEHYFAGDAHEDLMLMWQALQQGWRPPSEVTEEQYRTLRGASPSALRGFAGFASFGGKWFAGYPRGVEASTGRVRNYFDENARAITKQVPRIARANLVHADYRAWSPDARCVVYCDPPYAGTTGYSIKFDSQEFWAYADHWTARGAIVLVSEENAPAHWCAIWSKARRHCACASPTKPPRIEKLYVHHSFAAEVPAATAMRQMPLQIGA